MASITMTITTTSFTAPAGTVPGPFRFILTKTADNSTVQLDSTNLSVTFSNVGQADYHTSAQRIDANTGAVIGTPVTGRDVLSSEFTTNVDVPAAIVVSLSA